MTVNYIIYKCHNRIATSFGKNVHGGIERATENYSMNNTFLVYNYKQ